MAEITEGAARTVGVVPVDRERPPDIDQINEWCRTRLASYKKPTSLVAVEALPRNASGKVLKRELREDVTSGS